jgi:hypothetical protein
VTTTREGVEAPAEAPATPGERPPGDGAEAPRPARQPAASLEPAISGLPQLLRMVGVVAAPTTLLTSLLFYFGWSHAYWFFDYFGVNSTLLGLTTRDYMMRSLDGLFVPMTVVACAGLLVLWGHAMLRARLVVGDRPRAVGVLLPAAIVAGLALACAGVASVFTRTVLDRYLAAAPLTLAVGVLLLAYAVQLRRSLAAIEGRATAGRPEWVAVAEWAGVFVLVGLSLFWAANDYSAAVGRSRARQLVAELPTYPDAVVYSSRSLSLAARGVRQVRCHDPEAAYRFRYDGLKLVLQSGDQYLFLPAAWSPADGVAILMPKSDSLRLELVPASARAGARPETC